jgi:hypothetical protein
LRIETTFSTLRRKVENREKSERNSRKIKWICRNRQSDQSSVCWVHLCMGNRVRFKCNPFISLDLDYLCPGPSMNSTDFLNHGIPWSSLFSWENTH